MNNLISYIKYFISLVVCAVGYLFGGADTLLVTLAVCVCIDYISGVLVGWVTKNLSSTIGMRGIVKKVGIFAIVAVSQMLENITSVDGIRNLVISFYITNEGISILENWGNMGLPLPGKLKEILVQIKEGAKVK